MDQSEVLLEEILRGVCDNDRLLEYKGLGVRDMRSSDVELRLFVIVRCHMCGESYVE